MEIRYGQKFMNAYAIYVKETEYSSDRTEMKETVNLRLVVFDEYDAKRELNEVLDKFHEIYKINNPFFYERTVENEKISYHAIDRSRIDNFGDHDWTFWYDEIILNL